MAGRATLLVRAADGILGTHTSYAALVNAPTPSSRPGASCANSAAALGRPGNWPKPSTFFKPARSKDEKGSVWFWTKSRLRVCTLLVTIVVIVSTAVTVFVLTGLIPDSYALRIAPSAGLVLVAAMPAHSQVSLRFRKCLQC